MNDNSPSNPIQIVSFGGGVQSTALLVLAAAQPNKPLFLFANVGDDSESPATLAYIKKYAMPFAEANGITLLSLEGKTSLYEYAINAERSIPLPVWLPSGAYGRRSCTTDFKIRRIDRYLRKHFRGQYIEVALGISWDESDRMRPNLMQWTDRKGKTALSFHKRVTYPLIDQRITRAMCAKIITDAGLPVPPKSSCFFCPFKKLSEWITMKHEQPDLYAKALKLESAIRATRQALGKDDITLTYKGNLEDATKQLPLSLEYDPICDTGFCMN